MSAESQNWESSIDKHYQGTALQTHQLLGDGTIKTASQQQRPQATIEKLLLTVFIGVAGPHIGPPVLR
jgi:hypothetical protein